MEKKFELKTFGDFVYITPEEVEEMITERGVDPVIVAKEHLIPQIADFLELIGVLEWVVKESKEDVFEYKKGDLTVGWKLHLWENLEKPFKKLEEDAK